MLDRPPLVAPSIQLSPAAQYLRMSTDHQRYSIANQSAAIALYAAAHNMGIVRSFVDEGKTGSSVARDCRNYFASLHPERQIGAPFQSGHRYSAPETPIIA
jgi:hypothetical protein